MTRIGRLKIQWKSKRCRHGGVLVSREIMILTLRLVNLNNLITIKPISPTMALVNSNYNLKIRVRMVNTPLLRPKEQKELHFRVHKGKVPRYLGNIRNVAQG